MRIGGLALLIFAVWILQRPFAGIVHDSTLYSLLALSRIHPQSLSHDVFMRFGSQDEYTLFSPLFAAVIRWLALGPAAACLTFACQGALFACAYLFARRHMSAGLALLGVGLLVALPSDYGSRAVFHCIEGFLTPRLPAQALVLAGLTAMLASRFVIGVLCLLTAMLLHPIIGSAGIALLFCIYIAIPRPKLAAMLVVGCVATSLLLLLVIHDGPFSRFDAQWLLTVKGTSKFLFPTMWTLQDWSRASVPFAVLASGTVTSENRETRGLYAASLLVSGAGILLTLIYGDLLHVIIATAMQLWRWLWIANLIAIVFAPLIVRSCWNGTPAFRAVPLILASAWTLRNEPIALALSLLAIACALAGDRVRDPRMLRSIRFASLGVLLTALAAYVTQVSWHIPLDGFRGSAITESVRWLRVNAGDGLLYAAVLALAWRVSERLMSLRGAACLALLAVVPCVVLAATAWDSWTDVHYTDALRAKFAPWRRQIPKNAEVVWPETPVGAWYLLDRPSYWSPYQVPGDVFSRAKALELRRRELLIDAVLETQSTSINSEVSQAYFTRVDASGFRMLCADPQLGYFVTHGDFGPTPFEPITPDPARPRARLYLYQCTDFLKSTSPVTTAGAIHGISAAE